MRVLLDGRSAGLSRVSGWERYTRNLMGLVHGMSNVTVVTGYPERTIARITSDWISLPIAARKYDAVHYPTYPPTFSADPARTIMTIHDLTWWKYPATASLLGLRYYKPLMDKAARRKGQHIATVSNTVATELRDEFPDANVMVIPNSVTIDSVTAGDFHHPRPYLLSVGSVEPRKNLERVVQAFTRSGLQSEMDLVLIGRNAWGRLPKGIRFTGPVSDQQLRAAYEGSSGLVAGSLYEGFGLPLAEARSLGVPVACSDIPVFREVAAVGTIFFDPLSTDSIADGLLELASKGSCATQPENPFSQSNAAFHLSAAYQILSG